MKHILRASFVLISLLLLGCKGDVCKDLDVREATATLIWSGDYALDGCGYSVQIGETEYKPENEDDIDDSFKIHEPFTSTTVKLTYSPRGKKQDVGCGMFIPNTTIDYIYTLAVEKL